MKHIIDVEESYEHKLLKVGLDMLRWSGMYPRTGYRVVPVLIFFYTLRFYIIYLTYLYIIRSTDFDMMAEGFEAYATWFQGFARLFPLLWNKQKLIWLTTQLNDFWDVTKDEEISSYMKKAIKLLKIYRIAIYLVYVGYVLSPFYTHKPIFACWLPDRPYALLEVNAVQYVLGFYEVFHCVGTDFVFIALCVNVIIQFKFLNKTLVNLQPNDSELKSKMGQCIEHHQFLLDYIETIQQTFTMSLLYSYYMTTFCICIELYGINQTNSFFKIVLRVVFLFVITIQLALYGFPAEEVSIQASETSEAIYNCKWYDFDQNVKTLIPMVSARGQKDVIFTGGGLVIINRAAFTLLFKGSLSIYTFMNNMNEMNK